MRAWARVWAMAAALILTGCAKLNIYNWADYIDPALIDQFTRETGTKVHYDTYDSNEVLETKMLAGGTGYDLVVPSNHNLPRYIAAGAIQPLDKAKLGNLKNLDPAVVRRIQAFDPGERYSVPYMQGTIGLGYNVEAVTKRLGHSPDSWGDVFDPKNLAKLKDCGVYFLDASEDMYAVALRWLGKDPNTTDPADYAAATDMLMKLRPDVRKFHSSAYIDALANGDICLAIGYSGDVLQAKARAAEAKNGIRIAYAIPKEGSQVWYDLFVIPADAPHVDDAHRFLNFMLRPKIIARASDHTRYANANAAARPLVDPALRNDPNVYPPPQVESRLFVTTTKDQALLREVNRQWTRVMTGR